jgi:hypothetical protein
MRVLLFDMDVGDQRARPMREDVQEYQFRLAVRQGLLQIVDAIEKNLDLSPTTAECREAMRRVRITE